MAKRQKINSGELNQKIEIYLSKDIDDGSAGTIPGLELYWSTSAKVEQLRSRRDLQANQEVLKPMTMFTVRDRNDKNIYPDMQLKYRGQYYTINRSEPDFTYVEYLVITAHANANPER